MKRNTASVVRQFKKALPQFPAGLNQYHSYVKPTAKLPKAPPSLDTYTKIKRWPLDGNAYYGDCTMAAAAHAIHLWNVITHESNPVPLTSEVVREYRKFAKTPQAGLIEANVLKTWHRGGLWGHRILGYTPINVHNIAMIKQAAYLYGLVYVGVQLTKSAEKQYKQRKPWALVRDWKTEIPLGGHAIPIVGYDRDCFYVVTWGVVQKMTFEWWHTYGEEAWAIFPQQLKEAGGANHLNLAQLHADLKLL